MFGAENLQRVASLRRGNGQSQQRYNEERSRQHGRFHCLSPQQLANPDHEAFSDEAVGGRLPFNRRVEDAG